MFEPQQNNTNAGSNTGAPQPQNGSSKVTLVVGEDIYVPTHDVKIPDFGPPEKPQKDIFGYIKEPVKDNSNKDNYIPPNPLL